MKTGLSVKRIYEQPSPDDGARILVDRVWPRGVRKDAVHLTLWLKDIAPSTGLRKWFGHDPERWDEFCRRYRAELDANHEAVEQLRGFLKAGHVTLLYSARGDEHNQARALAEYLREAKSR